MVETETRGAAGVDGRLNGAARARPFPRLLGNAHPVAQERWDELVTTVYVAAPLHTVWSALTEPDEIVRWLGAVDSSWANEGAEACLDFEDGEFFLCSATCVEAPHDDAARLTYDWRWVGVGPATTVDWTLTARGPSTEVTVRETAWNAPSDWRSWNGMGWPGILDQLARFVRLGRSCRWPWRRMGPYVQMELEIGCFEAWAVLTSVPALQFWLGRESGTLAQGDRLHFIMGDASGVATLVVTDHAEPNQRFPSYLPSLSFDLERPGWRDHLSGHLWIEPAGLGRSVVQVFQSGWEVFGPLDRAPADRHLLTAFWAGAFGRLAMLTSSPGPGGPGAQGPGAGPPDRPAREVPVGPHQWSV